MIDIDPGETRRSTTCVLVPDCIARRWSTSADGHAEGHRPARLQIWVPIEERYTFDQTRAWVEKLSRTIGQSVPDLVSWEWEVSKRSGKLRLDFTQNAINKTLVAPFSPRPAHGAPVSVPITWDELDDPDLRPDRWNIDTIGERLASAGDPLAPLIGLKQRLPTL